MRTSLLWFGLVSLPLAAQWLNYPDAKIPRIKDGKPNLSAPAPRTAGGQPDFSGLWKSPTARQLNDLATGVQVQMTPRAEAIFRQRQANFGKDRPSGQCLPHGVTEYDAHHQARKWIQMPGQIVLLFEAHHSFREIFTDGRPLPQERDPAWFGYSIGKWEKDTLVVETVAINDKVWLDDAGHPITPSARLIERFRRPDFGHMEVELTIDDSESYVKPWTVKIPWEYIPDSEILDWVCENNKDLDHIAGR